MASPTPAIPTPVRTFTDEQDRPFTVRAVPAGARYGHDDRQVSDRAQVEFYDAAGTEVIPDDPGYPGGRDDPLGAFTLRRTYADMITHVGPLTLRDGTDAWQVDTHTMRHVTRWLSDRVIATVVISKSLDPAEAPAPGSASDRAS